MLTIDPISLTFLNIDSFMGGVRGIWNNSPNKTGVKSNGVRKVIDSRQSHSDGKIELFCYANKVKLGMERIIRGNACRVSQGSQFL